MMGGASRWPVALAAAACVAAALVAGSAVGAGGDAPARTSEPNTRVPEGDRHHAASAFPDRIAVSPSQDAATGFAVAWRTDARVHAPVLEIAVAGDSPDIGEGRPRRVVATTRSLRSRNGLAHQHRADVDGLQPGTLYAWRVAGAGTWSAWTHYRTPAASPAPLTLLYFGDTQNQNTALSTRVVRAARRMAPEAQLALFAGDLVAGGGAGMGDDDDEWAEWFEAASGLPEDIATAPAAGNHEYYELHEDTPREQRVLGPHWPLAFALPRNGAPGAESTTYWFDIQGVRVAVVDGTSLLDLGTGQAQARWLDRVLGADPQRWSIVLVHQPLFSPRAGRDASPLREHLAPVLAKHRVDLVLQGHDHVYGRRAQEPGAATPQLVVSVAGAKQYRFGDVAASGMSPVAEDTQLFQVLRVDGGVLRYEARTATGRLYDAFELHDAGGGARRLVDVEEGRIGTRRCPREMTLEGRRDRCWE